MTAEVISPLNIEVGDSVALPSGCRLIRAATFTRATKELEFANHNVFRLDAHNQVVWQVRRVENPGTPDWPTQHEMAKKWKREGLIDGAYTEQGYLDPFTSLGMDERGALSAEPQGIWRTGCVVYLLTRWWSYVLDQETGVATCTGDQVK